MLANRSHVKCEFTNTKKLAKKLARIEASSICRQQFANLFADCFCAVHTHQLEFANTSLPTLVCRVKAALKTYKLCWRTLWTSLPTSTSLVFARLSSVFLNELVLLSLAPCHSLNQGCKRFLKRFHASCQQNKTLFDTVSTGFEVHFLSVQVDYSSKSRSCVQSFDSFKPSEIELNVTNLEIARLCGSFSKKDVFIVWITLSKIVEKIRVTKLTYFATPWLHSSKPL